MMADSAAGVGDLGGGRKRLSRTTSGVGCGPDVEDDGAGASAGANAGAGAGVGAVSGQGGPSACPQDALRQARVVLSALDVLCSGLEGVVGIPALRALEGTCLFVCVAAWSITLLPQQCCGQGGLVGILGLVCAQISTPTPHPRSALSPPLVLHQSELWNTGDCSGLLWPSLTLSVSTWLGCVRCHVGAA